MNFASLRAFVQMRMAMTNNVELARRLDEMEARYDIQLHFTVM